MSEFIHVPVSLDPDSVRWVDIELFRRRFRTLWRNFKGLKLDRIAGSFSRQADGRHTGGYDNLPHEDRLKGLYVDFRHFYSNDEVTNVERFANYLSTLTDSIPFRQFMKEEKSRLRSPFIESGWYEYKGQRLSTRRFLDVWFNAEIFHSDSEKGKTLQEWKEIFSDWTARSMVFQAVYDSILVVRNVNWVTLDLARANLNLRMPRAALHAKGVNTLGIEDGIT